MMLSSLFLATAIFCCQNTCWALKNNEDTASLNRSNYDFVQNMVDYGITRNSGSCEDISSNCAANTFQCTTSAFVQGKCQKTCGLCNQTPDPWRADYRCGPKYPAPNGKPASCKNADCCSDHGWCGDSDIFCKCKGCFDFRDTNKVCGPCESNTSGHFAHGSDCRKLISCNYPHLGEYMCPKNTRFNNRTKHCEDSWKTECVTAQYTNPDGSCNPSGITKTPADPKCGVVKQVNRIVGGQETIAHQYPWMATIILRIEQHTLKCGGSLINNNWILTAAHCFYFYSKMPTIDDATIILGHHDLSLTASMQYTPKRLLRHSNFKATNEAYNQAYAEYTNDIALVELEAPVQYSETISPVCLPESDKPYIQTSVTVIGYGSLGYGISSSKLMKLSLSTTSNNECVKKGNKYAGISQNVICAWYAKGGKDSCQGDSGGPLMTLEENPSRYVQIGVVSVGPLDCGVNGEAAPGVYTRVSKYLDWIDSNTNGVLKDADPYYRK